MSGESDMPPELWLRVFIQLPLAAVAVCARVCKQWRDICDDVELWRSLHCKIEFGILALEDAPMHEIEDLHWYGGRSFWKRRVQELATKSEWFRCPRMERSIKAVRCRYIENLCCFLDVNGWRVYYQSNTHLGVLHMHSDQGECFEEVRIASTPRYFRTHDRGLQGDLGAASGPGRMSAEVLDDGVLRVRVIERNWLTTLSRSESGKWSRSSLALEAHDCSEYLRNYCPALCDECNAEELRERVEDNNGSRGQSNILPLASSFVCGPYGSFVSYATTCMNGCCLDAVVVRELCGACSIRMVIPVENILERVEERHHASFARRSMDRKVNGSCSDSDDDDERDQRKTCSKCGEGFYGRRAVSRLPMCSPLFLNATVVPHRRCVVAVSHKQVSVWSMESGERRMSMSWGAEQGDTKHARVYGDWLVLTVFKITLYEVQGCTHVHFINLFSDQMVRSVAPGRSISLSEVKQLGKPTYWSCGVPSEVEYIAWRRNVLVALANWQDTRRAFVHLLDTRCLFLSSPRVEDVQLLSINISEELNRDLCGKWHEVAIGSNRITAICTQQSGIPCLEVALVVQSGRGTGGCALS